MASDEPVFRVIFESEKSVKDETLDERIERILEKKFKGLLEKSKNEKRSDQKGKSATTKEEVTDVIDKKIRDMKKERPREFEEYLEEFIDAKVSTIEDKRETEKKKRELDESQTKREEAAKKKEMERKKETAEEVKEKEDRKKRNEEIKRQKKIEAGGPTPTDSLKPDTEKRMKFLETEVQRAHQGIAAYRRVLGQASEISGNAQSLLTNPGNFISGRMLGLLTAGGPIGAAIAAALGAALITPEVVKQIVKFLSQKGLPLNQDWKRDLESEVLPMFGIENNKRRMLGQDRYVITEVNRYDTAEGTQVFNSFENANKKKIAYSGQKERTLGVT